MKSIHKNLKAFFMFIAFLLCSFMFVLTPLKLVPVKAAGQEDLIPSEQEGKETENKDEENTKHTTFKSIHMPSDVNYVNGEVLKIPLLSEENNYTIRVVDKSGETHDLTITNNSSIDTSEDRFFNYVNDGEQYITIRSKSSNFYRIYYIQQNDSTLYFSDAYEVNVTGTKYGLETKQVVEQDGKLVSTNANVLFPTREKLNEKITLPTLYGYSIVDDNPVYDKAAEISVTFAGNPVTEEMYDKENKVLTFTEEGLYVVTYTYENENTFDRVTEEFTIDVDDNFVAPDVDKNQIYLSNDVALPTNVKLGDKDVVLPNPALRYDIENFSSTNVAKNVLEIVIKNEKTGVSKTLKNNNFTFDFVPSEFVTEDQTPLKENDYALLEGDYSVTYTVQDYFSQKNGNKTITKTIYFDYSFSKDNVSPTVQAVYDYTAFDEQGKYASAENVVSALAEIKSEYDYTASNGLLFPAVFVDSAVDEYSDLMVVRYFRNTETGKRYYIDGVKIDSATNEYVKVTENDGYNFAFADSEEEVIVANDEQSQKDYFNRLSKSAIFKFAKDKEDGEPGDLPQDVINQTFTLNYEVKVKSSHISTSSGSYGRQSALYQDDTRTEYTFKIVSGTETDTDLAINVLKNYDSTVYVGDKVQFIVNSTDNKDSRLINAVYYSSKPLTITGSRQQKLDELLNKAKGKQENAYKKLTGTDAEGYAQIGFGDKSVINYLGEVLKEELNGDDLIFEQLSANDGSNNQFNFEVPSSAHGKQLYILAFTINDNGKIELDNSAYINVADTSETTAPTIKTATFYNEATKNLYSGDTHVAGQGEKVYIPTVTFDDGEGGDKYLTTSVAYYVIPDDADTSVANVSYQNQYRYPEEYNLSNTISGYIKTDRVGTYVIVYTATDDAGNTTVAHYSFKVVSTAQPNIVVDVTGKNVQGSKTDGYTSIAGDVVYVNVHAYDGNDSSIELPHDNSLVITTNLVNVEGKHYTSPNGGYKLNSAGRYGFEVNVTWTDATGKKHSIPTYTFNVTAELESSADNLVWDENFTLPEYFSYEGENKVLQLPEWVATPQEGYVTETALLYKGPNDSIWNKATKNQTTGKWEFTPKSIGKYELSYETYASHGMVDYYSHKEKTITYGDNIAPKFNINAGALDDKITYNDKDITITVKLNKSSRIMVITASEGDKILYTWTSYADENNKKDNVNFKITENNEKGEERDNYNWTNLKVSLLNSQGTEITAEDAPDDGDFDVTEYTISSTGAYKFVFTIEDTAKNVGTREIAFNVTTKAEPTRISNSQLGIILIVVSSVILVGVILFFLLTGRGGKKQKPAATVSETATKKSTKKSSRKSSKKAEEKVEPAEENTENNDAE